MLIYKVKQIPDLTLSKYQVFADSGIDGLLNCQTQFLKQLYRVALLGNISIHFFVEYSPAEKAGSKISIYLCFCGEDDSYREKLRKVIFSSEVSKYFCLIEDKELVMEEQ